MSFIDYISGKRKGREANELEKESLRDQFLYEAMQGYDAIKDDDHIATITKLQKAINSGKKIKLKKKSSSSYTFRKIAAAALLLVFGLGGYMLIDEMRDGISNLSAKSTESTPMIIDIFVPEDFYAKNEVIIEQNNNSVVHQFSGKIEPFSVPNVTARITQDEMNELSEVPSVIDIYVPDNAYEQNKPNIEKGNSIVKEIIDTTTESILKIYIPEKDYRRFKDKIGEKE